MPLHEDLYVRNVNLNQLSKNSEVFSKNYQVFRNYRDSKGGGFFLGIHSDVTAIEQPDYVTHCEDAWKKVNLKSIKYLYVGSFYMPHRNSDDINQLNESLTMINRNTNTTRWRF